MSAVTIETIFRDMITLIGYEKSLQIVEECKPKVVETKVVEKPKEEEKKRIPRMSPALSDHLKTALSGVKVELNDKLKKEFVAYVNNLTEKDFASKGLIDHMRDFANTKKTTTETAVTVKTEEKPKKEKGKKKSEEKVTVVKETVPVPENGPSNAVGVSELTLSELQKLELIVTPGDKAPVGTFWDAKEGRWITGPDFDEDEYSNEVEFQGKKYMVGEKTGRVSVVDKDDNPTFHGFIGVGKFAGMKK
jgi:hypothetical protein